MTTPAEVRQDKQGWYYVVLNNIDKDQVLGKIIPKIKLELMVEIIVYSLSDVDGLKLANPESIILGSDYFDNQPDHAQQIADFINTKF
ncbi:MAG: hypothetical protein PHS07_00675 [Patescibacteria group bacterium]|nr:hypothetical protein [Patescibacteria group bacterium]